MSLSSLVVAGLNHRTTPMELRGLFSIDRDALSGAYKRLRELGIADAVILSTCNRTEVYSLSSDDGLLLRFYEEISGLPSEEVARLITLKCGEDAARHLFRVSSGLDSQIIGESEILGQVKRAWLSSRDLGLAGSYLDPLFQRALAVGKKVRSTTDLGKQAISIASLAIRLAEEQLCDLSDATAMIIGTGDMAGRILKELAANRPNEILIASRNPENATRLAQEFDATPISTEDIDKSLPEVDVIFAATNAQNPILDLDDLTIRRTDPMVLVDLGVPRNISPEVKDLLFARLYDMEDLQSLSDEHRKAREKEIPAAEAIIDVETAEFVEWSSQRSVAPIIASLKDQAEDLRQSLLGWATGKLGDISTDQLEVVDLLTQRMVKHFLRYPIAELRSCSGEGPAVETVVRMIGLSEYRPSSCVPESEASVGSDPSVGSDRNSGRKAA